MRRALVLAAALALLAVPPARANGDPASDVLITQPVYVGPEVPLSAAEKERLTETVEAANERGYPIRVAVIAFTGDLGTAVSLWKHPQTYAKFLGSELAFVYTKPLLIAMPSGFGIYHRTKPVGTERQALSRLRAGRTPQALVQSTTQAVRALAASEGIVLPTGSSGGSEWRDKLIIAGVGLLIVALIAALVARSLRRGGAVAES
jgi:hypothetical protein